MDNKIIIEEIREKTNYLRDMAKEYFEDTICEYGHPPVERYEEWGKINNVADDIQKLLDELQ